MIDGQSGKFIKNLSVEYTRSDDFYRPTETYFGKVSGITVNNADNTLIDNVEVSGVNRAGVQFVSTAVMEKNPATGNAYKTDLQKGMLGNDDAKHVLGDNNQVINSHLHDNRVAGVLFSYQTNFTAKNNILAHNGHQDDGGTGYGVASMAGTYNDHITFQNNTTDHNHRKGLDVHDGNHIIISDNTSIGDRLHGIAVYNRQFNMDNVVIKDNIISQDPTFRLPVDDNFHIDGQTYYGYAGIQIQTNTQPEYTHYVGSPTGTFDIVNNTITGIDVFKDEHHTYGIEFRNHEPNMHYTLNITNNTITGKETKYIIAVMNNGTDYFNQIDGKAGSGQGFGDINISHNKAVFETLNSPQSNETPINLQEDQKHSHVRGNINITHNDFAITKASNSGAEMFQIVGNAKNINISDNTLSMVGDMNKATFSILNRADQETTVQIHHNTLHIDDGQNYQNFISATNKVNLTGTGNTINGNATKEQFVRHTLAKDETLILNEQDDVLVFGGDVHGHLYLGQGSDNLTVRGTMTGTLYTHTDGKTHDDSTDRNIITLRGDLQGTKTTPATIYGGDGIETIIVDKNVSHAIIDTGKVQDVIAIKGNLSDSTISTGDGNDTLYLSGLLSNSTISTGLGIDTLVLQGKQQSLTNFIGSDVSLSGMTGVDYVRIGGTELKTPDGSQATTTHTARITLADLIHNDTDKLFITGDDNDTVDLGADGTASMGGFVKHTTLQSPTYDIYHDGTQNGHLLYIDKHINVI